MIHRIARAGFEDSEIEVGVIDSAYNEFRNAGAEYGDTAKIEKDVRVVTTITFYLSD